jgi:H+-transporting ATPase
MIVLLALLNDGSILSIAYDNVRYKDQPEAWNMRLVLGIASVLGSSARSPRSACSTSPTRSFDLADRRVQTLMYLMLSVAGSMTIYLTRTRGPFWSIRPARKLVIAVTGAQTSPP